MVIASEVKRRHEVFGIPYSATGRVVAELELRWAWVDDVFQAIICHEWVQYPHCVPATAAEIREILSEREDYGV